MGSPREVVYPPLAASCLASKTGYNTPPDNRRAYILQVQAIRSTGLHEVLKARFDWR
jgi:hypothetical protein